MIYTMHVLYTHASHPPMSARTHTLLHLMHLCTHTHTRPCMFAQSMVYARVAIDVLAPMCWHVISGACVLGHAVARLSTDMRACANAYARVPMRVLGPMSWHACNARTHSRCARLADFCDGDVAPRSWKRSRRLPHAYLRVRIRMRVRARSCVRESLCLLSHMSAHA